MFTVTYYPPGREDVLVFSCKDKPRFTPFEESGLHTLMVEFVPLNGTSRNKLVTVPAAHCLTEIPEHQ